MVSRRALLKGIASALLVPTIPAFLKASGAMKRAYIPLYDFFWVSGLGYEIRVLEARDNANWEGLLSYMNDLISVGLVSLSCTNKDKEDLV